MNATARAKQIIIAMSVALALMIAVGYVYLSYQNSQTEKQRALELVKLQQEEEAAAKAQKDKELEEFRAYLNEQRKLENEMKVAQQGKQDYSPTESEYTPPKEQVTKNPDGSVDIKNDYSKPEPPAPPTVPEDEKKNPSSKPEYKPEDKTDNAGSKPGEVKPSEPEKPTGGSTNNKGEIYVPGFGWMPNQPSTGVGEVAENAGKGAVIGK